MKDYIKLPISLRSGAGLKALKVLCAVVVVVAEGFEVEA